jgi:PKHD-type hydroxylase
MHYGDHVDNSVRVIPGTPVKLRTDVSATLFLTPPDQYDGGELIIEDTYGAHSAKLAAGDMIVYPASSVHRVAPVTRGSRTACFLWMQSLVRDDARRALLFDLDNSIQRLNAAGADESARSRLTACYHNLLRMWAETS